MTVASSRVCCRNARWTPWPMTACMHSITAPTTTLNRTRRWKEIRLKPGLSEIEVYRKLPHASGFEYGGYVTKSRFASAAVRHAEPMC